DGSTTIAEYLYAGPAYRVVEKRLPQAGVTLYRAYDGERRVVRHDQRRDSDDMRLSGFSYAWDRVGNRHDEPTLLNNTDTAETDGDGEAYTYDSVYRLRDYLEAVPSSDLDALASNAPRHTAAVESEVRRHYALDGVGNRYDVQLNGRVETAYAQAGADA